ERIVAARAGESVLAQHRLLLPRVAEICGVRRDLTVDPIAALYGLAAVPPTGDALGVDALPLEVHSGNEKRVAGVLQVLEDRAGVLPHQDRVRRVVVDAELVADAVGFGDLLQRDPHPWRIRDVVVEVVAGRPSGHGTLLHPILEVARLLLLQQRLELLLEMDAVVVNRFRIYSTL